MKFDYDQKEISGICLIIPENEILFDDLASQFDFPADRSAKLKQVMGYEKQRIAKKEQCSSDLVIAGFRHLASRDLLDLNSLDALIVVSQTPDFLVPGLSHIIHGALGLKPDVFCLDIVQGCAGYLVGLQQALSLLDQTDVHKVALITVDVLSKKVSPLDRNSFPLAGDAAAITIVECCKTANSISGELHFDGSRYQALMIPAGGIRTPSTSETAVLKNSGDGNQRALDHLVMDGTAVFNFVLNDVPPLIERVISDAQAKSSEFVVDYYLFHQPNKFILQKLSDILGLNRDQVFMNLVENYGNSNSATIPAVTCLNLTEQLLNKRLQVCLAGFGVGLSWGAMTLGVGPLNFCETIEV